MTIYYADSTHQFYLPGQTPPGDAFAVSDEDYRVVTTLNPSYSFSFVNQQLVITPPITAEDMWTRIQMERERRKNGGVQVGGHWFHTDIDSRIQIMGLVILGANMPANIQWKVMEKAADGSRIMVPMTPALASAIFLSIANLDQLIFTAAETHRIAMEAAAKPYAYDYSGGWPPQFAG